LFDLMVDQETFFDQETYVMLWVFGRGQSVVRTQPAHTWSHGVLTTGGVA
jgi:hypothetical protein